MWKIYSVYILLIFNFSFVKSQEFKSNSIYINPIQVFSLYHSNIEIGYERSINKKLSLDHSLGIIIKGDAWGGNKDYPVERKNGSGFIFHIGPKYYFKSKSNEKEITNSFISIKPYFVYHNYESNRYKDTSYTEIVKYKINSKNIGCNFLFGQKYIVDNFFVEYSVGAGLRYLFIKNYSDFDVNDFNDSYRINKYFEPENNGKYFRFSILFNLKFGYIF